MIVNDIKQKIEEASKVESDLRRAVSALPAGPERQELCVMGATTSGYLMAMREIVDLMASQN